MKKVGEFYCKTRPTKQEIESLTKSIKCVGLFQEPPIIRLTWDCQKSDLLPKEQQLDSISGTMRMSVEFDEKTTCEDVENKINEEYARNRRLFETIYSTETED